jgi:mRNA interferase MazF
MARRYIPDRGDIVWLQFNPQTGHEQAGHRPALVLSPAAYNEKTGLMLCCPMTSRIKGYSFEVMFSAASSETGVVLADQVKSLDWRSRKAKRKGKAPKEVVTETLAKLHALLDFE